MQEIYQRAAKIYKELVDNPPSDPDLCSCANDVTANGILTEVVNIARQLKYRARDARSRGSTDGYERYAGIDDRYNSYAKPKELQQHSLQKRETKEDISRLREEYLENSNEETAMNLLKVSPWIPGKMTGPDQWISYSAMLTVSLPSQQGIKDFGTFIFCKLNQPRDHPADLFNL